MTGAIGRADAGEALAPPGMRIIIRFLSLVVIASAAVTVWTRAQLGYLFGARQAAVLMWIAAGGTLCAVITLARTRKPRP